MKLDNSSTPSFQDMTELLSKMKTFLIDVLLEKSLSDGSRMKLKDCMSMVESFSRFLNNNCKKEPELLKPLHSGLSRSTENLNPKKGKISSSRSASDLASMEDMYDNDEDGDIDLNNLKENYLQAVNEFKNNHEINGNNNHGVDSAKPEVNSDKPEIKHSKLEINSTQSDVIKSNKEQNYGTPEVNGVKPEMNEVKPEVVRREGDGSKRRRKRDSSTLFDISLDDLTEPDHSGFLTEKHSGMEWWCVLQDQHLCMFPSQNSQELAYDVLLVPCCEISLDDVYTGSPVFRLTQVGSTPWVFSAGIERNLRAWIRALYRACGRDDADWSMRSSKKGRRKDKKQKRNMKVFTSTIDESEEVEEEETGQEVGHENEMKEERQKGLETEVTPMEDKEMKTVDGKEKLKDGKDVYNADEDAEEKDLAMNGELDEEEQNMDPVKRKQNSENVEEKEARTLGVPDVNKETKENVNQGKKDEQQEEVSKARKENETEELQVEDCRDANILGKQENSIENTNITFEDDDGDYVVMPRNESAPSKTECDEVVQCKRTERRATKKRIKLLRWLKKAIVDKGQDDVTVIGDIYRIECPDNHVKLWCVLHNRQLCCYKSVSDTTPQLMVPLDNCIALEAGQSSSKMYVFVLEKDGVKLATFAARTAKERARWIEIVRTKRGTFPLGELGDESGEEAAGSGTSEEDDDDDDHEYIEVPDSEYAVPEYVVASSEHSMGDAGYISVLALESEIIRRKSLTKTQKYRSGLEYLIKRETPLFMGAVPQYSSLPCKNRSPAPLPRDHPTKNSETSKDVPAEHVESNADAQIDTVEHANETNKDSNNNKSVDSSDISDEETSSHENGIHCQLTASSWLPDSPPRQARFGQRNSREDMSGSWRPETNDKVQFLEIDIGDVMTVDAIAIQGRPDFDEKGGEFVKSFTVHYSVDKKTWTPYKSYGKVKIFQGMSNANQVCKKYFKSTTTAQYFRVHPQSWQNHIALRVALFKEYDTNDMKSKGLTLSPKRYLPLSPILALKAHLKKEDISNPMDPSSDCLKTNLTDPANIIENGIKMPNTVEPAASKDGSENPASMESRIKLREKLLSKEKREQITKLEVLSKIVGQAKNKMIVVNTSAQLKREAIEAEHDYLVANLELVKAKKRLIDIETEVRELRLFDEKYRNDEQQEFRNSVKQEELQNCVEQQESKNRVEQQELKKAKEIVKPPRPPQPLLKRRPSKEVMVYTDAVTPEVDPGAFNTPGDPPPARKVFDNVKLFENLQNQY